eukprot:CAMPEP_0198330398 /NCGR_PEP_ID=MMETSP1450-20131203/16884_1 /TAXON_ID=753684 ORGANISM="Madagascaria erythrocladiodes, Strain CCMP3234" /NCGR_SAMPLE_ID=MMETSP1450 /ASSEMBLY_ACC=CAM_ASM_001115 /LENGTH=448 /DNA_ID=CAMNT_0044034691 /DNA_START=302 /DNA_END=1651 /DNA_ORIENTATION=+
MPASLVSIHEALDFMASIRTKCAAAYNWICPPKDDPDQSPWDLPFLLDSNLMRSAAAFEVAVGDHSVSTVCIPQMTIGRFVVGLIEKATGREFGGKLPLTCFKENLIEGGADLRVGSPRFVLDLDEATLLWVMFYSDGSRRYGIIELSRTGLLIGFQGVFRDTGPSDSFELTKSIREDCHSTARACPFCIERNIACQCSVQKVRDSWRVCGQFPCRQFADWGDFATFMNARSEEVIPVNISDVAESLRASGATLQEYLPPINGLGWYGPSYTRFAQDLKQVIVSRKSKLVCNPLVERLLGNSIFANSTTEMERLVDGSVIEETLEAFEERSSSTEHKGSSQKKRRDRRRAAVCPICGKSFAYTWSCDRHMKSAHSGPRVRHECSDCGATFAQASNLTRHYNVVHTGGRKRNFICQHCGDDFLLKHHLIRHIRNRHKTEDIQGSSPQTT